MKIPQSMVKEAAALAKSVGKERFTISDLWKATGPEPPDDVWYVLRWVMVNNPEVFEKVSANLWCLKNGKGAAPKRETADETMAGDPELS